MVAVSLDRKSTRLNSSHTIISYAVFCLKKKKHGTEKEVGMVERGVTLGLAVVVEITHTLCGSCSRISRPARPPTLLSLCFFFFNNPAPPEIYPLPLHDAFPI